MEDGVNKANGFKKNPAPGRDLDEDDNDLTDGEEDNERTLLLPTKEVDDEILGSSEKLRKVQWNDSIGNDLAEVLEFQPSEPSESDDEESDSCMCTIM